MMRDIDFHLKYCILGEYLKLSSSGSNPRTDTLKCLSKRQLIGLRIDATDQKRLKLSNKRHSVAELQNDAYSKSWIDGRIFKITLSRK